MSDGTTGPVIINGIKADNPAKPPVRMEVRDMIKTQPDQWNLYLLGLERFQKSVAENMPLSYFQIAGIHGLPYVKWPNQNWNKMTQVSGRTEFGGFCTHSSILFLPWHRPYLALFEAELYKHVNAIANEFGDNERKADYVKAAKTFRMPYWDWARPDLSIFPPQAGPRADNQVVKPKRPQKAAISPNPLAAYQFRESASNSNINWFPDVNATVRYPAQTSDTPDEVSMKQDLTAFFEGTDQNPKGRNLTERVLFILQSYNNFGAASSNRFNSQSITPGFEEWGSIEDIHNAIHTYTGGNGQMSSPPVSSFDPIFWLHHTNIDRLFAIWQACHDDPNVSSTYVTPKRASNSTFSMRAGSTENITTPLTPFAQSGTKDKQNFWTSEGARYTKSFGYVYPETQDWLFPTREAVLAELNRLYQRASLANILSSTGVDLKNSIEQLRARAVSHLKVENKAESNLVSTQAINLAAVPPVQAPLEIESQVAEVKVPEDRSINKLADNNKYLEWLVNIKALKAELGGNYVVHVFLGDPDDSAPILYVTNHSHVGAFSTFGQGENTACQNCQDGHAEGLQITGQIPLTLALVERYLAGLVDDLSPSSIIPYLQKNLHWRVTLPGGERRSRGELNDLLVSVVTNEVTIPDSPNGLPQYSDQVIPRPEATTNREGGARGNGTGYIGGQVTSP
ncbi:hypothetical protein JX266_005289 [Neoarthrinium moseri]|nr:hypothetical protein JX266_005289 [Neoarthrinium moseri]